MSLLASLPARQCAHANLMAVRVGGASARTIPPRHTRTQAIARRRAGAKPSDPHDLPRMQARTRAARRGLCAIEFLGSTNELHETAAPPRPAPPHRHRPARNGRDAELHERVPRASRTNPTEPARPRFARASLPARPLVHRPADWPKTVTAPSTPPSTSPAARGMVQGLYS